MQDFFVLTENQLTFLYWQDNTGLKRVGQFLYVDRIVVGVAAHFNISCSPTRQSCQLFIVIQILYLVYGQHQNSNVS